MTYTFVDKKHFIVDIDNKIITMKLGPDNPLIPEEGPNGELIWALSDSLQINRNRISAALVNNIPNQERFAELLASDPDTAYTIFLTEIS